MSISKVFYHIGKHFLDSITYAFGIPYILAGLITTEFIIRSWDLSWRQFTTITHPWVSQIGFISVIFGFLIPLFGPVCVYIYGKIKTKTSLQIAGLATGQAAILGLFVSSFIKIFTGRLPPEAVHGFVSQGGFQFGFLRGGVFNGWPSSHTTVAFAMAVTLLYLYPKNTAVKICALFFALIIGLGVSANIHWLSDVVAGAIIGYTIGQAVGREFENVLHTETV